MRYVYKNRSIWCPQLQCIVVFCVCHWVARATTIVKGDLYFKTIPNYQIICETTFTVPLITKYSKRKCRINSTKRVGSQHNMIIKKKVFSYLQTSLIIHNGSWWLVGQSRYFCDLYSLDSLAHRLLGWAEITNRKYGTILWSYCLL